MLCEYNCGNEAKYFLKNKKWCCSTRYTSCPTHSKRIKEGRKITHSDVYKGFSKELKDRINWSKGKILVSDDEIFRIYEKQCQREMNKEVVKRKKLPYKCDICNLFSWQNQPLHLELHHKNGNRLDNRIENLQFLCPNCHSQTPTFKSKNRGSVAIKVDEETLRNALKTTDNIHQALQKVNLIPAGDNYIRARRLLNKINGAGGEN